MRYLEVGADKHISKIGLGTHQFGSPDWGYGDRYAGHEARAIVRRALELGVTLFDTAEIYGFEASRIARRAVVEGVALSDLARIPVSGAGSRSSAMPLATCGSRPSSPPSSTRAFRPPRFRSSEP